jgi:hypothetical protein
MINRGTDIGVLLPAADIPPGAVVTKPTGTSRYILRHSLRLFQNQDSKAAPPIDVAGTFLINEAGAAGRGGLWVLTALSDPF